MNLDWYKELDIDYKKVKKVLFVCTGNTCRSPACEYYFNSMTGWFSSIKAFSRGSVERSEAIPMELSVKKVIGDRKLLKNLYEHTATKYSEKDFKDADLVFTMNEESRDNLKKEFPIFKEKIFTLKGFIGQQEFSNKNLEVQNPFVFDKPKEGTKEYYTYIQNYANIIEGEIKPLIRRLVEILFLLKK